MENQNDSLEEFIDTQWLFPFYLEINLEQGPFRPLNGEPETSSQKISLMIWCLAYVPVWLVARMFYVFCYSRSKKSVLVLWGQTLNQLVNMILKNYIAQPRPAHTGYGMPSSHAQFMFFYLTFNPSFMNLLLAVLTCFSRVHDGYHTVEQIIVGAFVGFVCAMAKMETSSFDSDLVDFGNMVVYRLTGYEIVKGE